MRTSPVALLTVRLAALGGMFDLIPTAKIPASHQLLRLPFSTSSRQLKKILRTIDIASNPGQFEHNTRQSRSIRRGPVRQKAVVPKAKRKQITGRPPGRICPTSRRIRNQHRASVRRTVDDLLQFGAVD